MTLLSNQQDEERGGPALIPAITRAPQNNNRIFDESSIMQQYQSNSDLMERDSANDLIKAAEKFVDERTPPRNSDDNLGGILNQAKIS